MIDAAPATVEAYMEQPRAAPSARITYGAAPSQVIELFLPKGRRPYPVVVMLHGGCYLQRFEGLPQTSGIAADLARRGYAVWNVEYRRLGEPGAEYPGVFQDVATAVDHIRAEARGRGLDASRVIALGHSAGGHLALWAAARHRIARTSPLWRPDPLPIRAVISLGGIGDLKGHGEVFAGACGDAIPRLVGDRFADTSPAELLPGAPRVVMIHGVFDHVMPPHTGRAYAERVRQAGGSAEAIAIPGAGHFDVVMPTTPAWELVAHTVAREVAALR